ncbi:MAG: hypothetical protein HYZ46_06170, partial [Nitrosomonadales bacterium]|nr:hypothetical protein [Nitrosomonadales bacterium]
ELADNILGLSKHEEENYICLLYRHLKLHILFDSAPLEVVLSAHYYDLQPE